MARPHLSNTLVFLLLFSIPHISQASKPTKTITVNPCTFTPTIPTVVSPSSPCPTVTISTSHTSCPPTNPTSCSQNFCISDAFISVPCTCPYSVPTTTVYTPCPSACSQTCFIGHQIYRETSCSTPIDTYTYTTPTTSTSTTTSNNLVTCSCPYYPPYPTNCIFPCPEHTPSTTTTSNPTTTSTTNPTTSNNLVTCSCPYYPPYPTNCIFPCPVHTPTTVITVPTTITSISTPSCDSITVTTGKSCPLIIGGPCESTSFDVMYLPLHRNHKMRLWRFDRNSYEL
ncbi:e6c12a51-57cd-4254-8ea1-cd16404c53ad [Sclerotinia trifoliorum]|uniref:E6c12a51-57cd-4254-8ea1-cd16404c53ad n=1 Tax=Sclerotinia trifoliorum TaxID=28548 RepID=A0A8H2VTE8_9HELO|nr:e6c12a51-57cd-4254-8ea1-cd16404c53ad [Sclerotinia trifoliorum]